MEYIKVGSYLASLVFGAICGLNVFKDATEGFREDSLGIKEELDDYIYTENNIQKFPEELIESNIFICSITLELLREPVITKYGNTYEKDTILDWISKNKNDPLTKQPLSVDDLRPNIAVKHAIKYLILKEKYNSLAGNQLDKI